ncbi:hypothetical protein JWG45_18865 [Leptospira sp. 201903070]|jgi:hypothetical protein|uniref:Uncharacterized protein n=1 Tax=Leptospira ainlahdjerensis TaxID=2810033 RepID=A0ABS2UFR9_9LEPT|nr:hypothetical protein [Leptospira ainlahdjerensis]MBM9579210.1 hypothetical protein [Leptospira ainlahdjerensis]
MSLFWVFLLSFFSFFLGKRLGGVFGLDPPYSLLYVGILIQLYSAITFAFSSIFFLTTNMIFRIRSKDRM